jgi:hypothetical protein
LIAAQQYARNIIANDGTPKINSLEEASDSEKTRRVNAIKDTSRKNLAYSAFADMLGSRTSVQGSKTGTWLRSFYSLLSTKGTGYSADIAKNIPDDMSYYEFKEHMYSKMYTNPDWLISLETPEKQLQLEQLDIVNKNMNLEWDTFLTLEKLATIDGVNLATTLDNSEK